MLPDFCCCPADAARLMMLPTDAAESVADVAERCCCFDCRLCDLGCVVVAALLLLSLLLFSLHLVIEVVDVVLVVVVVVVAVVVVVVAAAALV